MNVCELDVNSISIEVIPSVEEAIGIHEYVSMIFLLYDEVPSALERINISLNLHFNKEPRNISALLDWVMVMHSDPYWKYKFVEALVICKCYSVISNLLGLNLEAVSEHFLPKSLDTSLHIHPIKKVLYHMCEDYDRSNSNKFIELTNQSLHFDLHGTKDKINSNLAIFMEFFLLKLVQGKLVRLGQYSFKEPLTSIDNKCNIELIADICKHINVKYCARLLETERRINGSPNSFAKNTECVKQSQSDVFKQLTSVKTENNEKSNNYCSEDENYPLKNLSEVGVCIIINQREFNCFNREMLPYREGTDKDRDRLVATWTKYNAKCYVFNNLTSLEIISNIEHTVENKMKSYHGFLAIFILSHGIEGAVYGTDGMALRIEQIKDCISGKNAPSLIEKPRMIIIQACQGIERLKNRIQFDGPVEKAMDVMDVSDILIFTSTLPNFVSVRDPLSGSWFIQTLCNVLDGSNGSKHLVDLFIDTIRLVADKKDTQVDISMHPRLEIMWRKKLFLPKQL